MSVGFHPKAELQTAYRRADISPGVALAIAGHLELCPSCALTFEDAIDRTTLRSPLNSAAFPSVISNAARGQWLEIAPGVRRAALRRVSGLGESVHLVELSAGAVWRAPQGTDLMLILSGTICRSSESYERGDFVHLEGSKIPKFISDKISGCTLVIVGSDSIFENS